MPNNGTLRLPLKPVGVHSEETIPATPVDPVDLWNSTISIDPIEASSAADPHVVPPHLVGVDDTDAGSADRPVVEDENQMTEEEKEEVEVQNFWDYVLGKIDGWKAWAGGLVSGAESESGDVADASGSE